MTRLLSFLWVLGVCGALLMVGGCTRSAAVTQEAVAQTSGANGTVWIWRDADTGCDYVVGDYHGTAITPRLGPDGKPICRQSQDSTQ